VSYEIVPSGRSYLPDGYTVVYPDKSFLYRFLYRLETYKSQKAE